MTYAQNHGGDPLIIPPQVGDVAEGVRICGGLGNALSVDLGDALLQLDSGDSPQMAAAMLTDLRAWRPDLPVNNLVYSHGHIGYNVGASTWLATANPAGAPPPVVVAQQNVPAFIAAVERFEGLAHLNLWIEFAIPDASPPIEIVQPTVTFDQRLTIRGATREVELLAIPSETPDALALWIPDVGVLHGGATVTPTLPNSGEPTVVHADLDTWADSLERMDALGASRLVRGFGGTVDGTAAVHDVLSTMAAGLRWVSNTVADRMNQGWSLREILTADLHYPESIFGKDYMHRTRTAPARCCCTRRGTRSPAGGIATPRRSAPPRWPRPPRRCSPPSSPRPCWPRPEDSRLPATRNSPSMSSTWWRWPIHRHTLRWPRRER